MATTSVTESVLVRRPVADVAPQATDPDVILPLISGLGRFQLITRRPDGTELWDVFLDVGSIHIGGRVEVPVPEPTVLSWKSVRGTRHSCRLEVTEEGEGHARLAITMTLELAGGLLAARLAGFLAGGIVRRHLQAGLEQLRHHLEHEL
jgi:carbon monoxide dehydrogenase subunit G